MRDYKGGLEGLASSKRKSKQAVRRPGGGEQPYRPDPAQAAADLDEWDDDDFVDERSSRVHEPSTASDDAMARFLQRR